MKQATLLFCSSLHQIQPSLVLLEHLLEATHHLWMMSPQIWVFNSSTQSINTSHHISYSPCLPSQRSDRSVHPDVDYSRLSVSGSPLNSVKPELFKYPLAISNAICQHFSSFAPDYFQWQPILRQGEWCETDIWIIA